MMALPPKWKIKRELWRIWDKTSLNAMGLIYDPPRNLIYNRRFDSATRVISGQISKGSKVAILAIFQPKGIALSTLFTLDQMFLAGYRTIVVTNAPLTEADEAALSSRATTIVERPNIGYDFGAYRDGLRVIQREGIMPECLVLMNDSTWFPLRENDRSIARLESSGADFAGHVFKTESDEKRGRDHIESHFLMFSREAQESDEFRRFWKKYMMSDTRELTVRRGEKAISQIMIKGGFSLYALLSRELLLEKLEALDDADLLTALKDIVHHRNDARAFCTDLIASTSRGDERRKDFLDWVDVQLRNSRQHLASSTFVSPAMRFGLQGFLKKSHDLRHHLARKKVLALEATGAIAPLHPDVRTEIEHSVATWKPPRDYRSSKETGGLD